jgi:F-type H+-transporting ATPase subunit epsilon
MADPITLEVVTPERQLLRTRVSMVVAPGALGEFGVLPGHVPLMTLLGTGILSYRSAEGVGALVVSEGYAEVADDQVTVLAEHADLASEVDLAQAREDIRALEEQLKAHTVVDDEFRRMQAELGRSTSKITLASRR